jgi:hypothetical protein
VTSIFHYPKVSVKKIYLKLNYTIDLMNFIDICRVYHPTAIEHLLFLEVHGSFSEIDHLLGHKHSFFFLWQYRGLKSGLHTSKALSFEPLCQSPIKQVLTNIRKLNRFLMSYQIIMKLDINSKEKYRNYKNTLK